MAATSKVSAFKWKMVTLGLSVGLISLIVWDGADRRAADATAPLPQGTAVRGMGTPPRTLKLGSFNIHSGKGTDGVVNLARTADLLADLDVVGLYEVRATRDSKQPNQAASLASSHEMAWLFAPTERQWWSDHFGNGLIFRVPVVSVIRIPLVNTRGKAYRNAILATASLDGGDVRIIAVHIDRERDRQLQLQTVIDVFLELKEPCVLMGDLNTLSNDPMLTALRQHPSVRSPLHEFLPEGPPEETIDWIFTRGLPTISATLVENDASDHPLIKVEVKPLQALNRVQIEQPDELVTPE